MTRVSTPILLFAGPAAIPTSQAATRYYADGINAPISVVRPHRLAKHDKGFPASVSFIDDEALPGFERVAAGLRALDGQLLRTGNWYLQQYIKLASLSAVGADLVFINDGDSIFSSRLLTEILDRPVVLCTRERVDTYNRLLSEVGIEPIPQSCIANGGFFVRARIPAEWLDPEGFIDLVARHVIPSRSEKEVSEYQMMGSILAGDLGLRRISVFRRYDLLIAPDADLAGLDFRNALKKYEAVAIEQHHRPSFIKRVAAHIFYRVGASW